MTSNINNNNNNKTTVSRAQLEHLVARCLLSIAEWDPDLLENTLAYEFQNLKVATPNSKLGPLVAAPRQTTQADNLFDPAWHQKS